MAQYLSVDLLLIAPNAVSSWDSAVDVPLVGLAIETGNTVTTSTGAPRTTAFTLTWNVKDRADLTALTDFLDDRKGQLVPCWIPTYQRDLDFIGNVPFYGDVVTANAFSALLADYIHLRHFIVRTAGGVLYGTRYWNLYADPADGTHVYTSTPGSPAPSGTAPGGASTPSSASGAVWSRLMFCRMASDTYTVNYLGKASVVTAAFVEVAGEIDA